MQALDDMHAGVELVDVLASLDVESLGPDGQLSYLAACERISGWVRSLQDRALVAFVGSNPRNTVYTVDGDEHALVDARRAEVVAELRWSEAFAHRRITEARAMAADLPGVRAAVQDGALASGHVQAIVEGAAALTAPVDAALVTASRGGGDAASVAELRRLRARMLERFEARVVPYAAQQSVARSRQQVRRAVASLDPVGFAARRAHAIREQSGVRLDHLSDGLSMISAVMGSERAIACMRVIDTLARDARVVAPGQRIGARRVDALVALVTSGIVGAREMAGVADVAGSAGDGGAEVAAVATPAVTTGRPGPSVPGQESTAPGQESSAQGSASAAQLRAFREARSRARVDIVIDLAALLGLSNDNAMLQGVGPLPAEVVRDLVRGEAGVALRRIVTDPVTGAVVEVGKRSYAIDAALRRWIDARDAQCRFPGCTQPATRCECDHALPFDAGGSTSTANLGLACKRHHQCKTHGGWRIVDSDASGGCTWVSPLGRTYAHAPEPVLPGSNASECSGLDHAVSDEAGVKQNAFGGGLDRSDFSWDDEVRAGVVRIAPVRDDVASDGPVRDDQAVDAVLADTLQWQRLASAWGECLAQDDARSDARYEDATSEVVPSEVVPSEVAEWYERSESTGSGVATRSRRRADATWKLDRWSAIEDHLERIPAYIGF